MSTFITEQQRLEHEAKLIKELLAKGGVHAAFARGVPAVRGIQDWMEAEMHGGDLDVHGVLHALAQMLGTIVASAAKTHSANCPAPIEIALMEVMDDTAQVAQSYLNSDTPVVMSGGKNKVSH